MIILTNELAVHEAAHAVAAFVAGVPIKSATIAWNGRCRGHVALDVRSLSALTPDEWALIGLAGAAAHARQRLGPLHEITLGNEIGRFVEWGDDAMPGDGLKTQRILPPPRQHGMGMTDPMRGAQYRAAEFVSRPVVWRAIEAVAEALLARKTLDGSEVEWIIRSAVLAS